MFVTTLFAAALLIPQQELRPTELPSQPQITEANPAGLQLDQKRTKRSVNPVKVSDQPQVIQQKAEGPKVDEIRIQPMDRPNQGKSVRLQDQSLDEIRKIRERIGIKLFDNPASQQEFSRQLNQLQRNCPPNLSPTPPATKASKNPPTRQLVRPNLNPPRPKWTLSHPLSTVPSPRSSNQPVFRDHAVHPASGIASNRIASRSGQATLDSLILSVQNLDRLSLELELQGEVAKSKKLRKLSRQIRKQLRELTNARDN